MPPVETPVERRLRAGLQAWQDEIAPAPAGFSARLRERERRRRRAQASAAAGLVAAAAVLGTAGSVARGILADGAAPSVAAEPDGGAGRLGSPDLTDVPTRGSLAGDAGWVAAVRESDWPAPDGLPAERFVPRPEDRHVAFAGDVPGGRVALVLGEIGNRTLRMWFTGPADAGPGDLRPAVEADDVLTDRGLALWELMEDGAEDGVLVVVDFPGVTASYAPGLVPLDPVDGRVVEEFRPLALEDGAGSVSAPRPVVAVPLPTTVSGTTVDLEVGDRAAAELGLPVLEDPRGLRAAVPDEWLDHAVEELVRREGIEPRGLTVTLVQAGGVRDTPNRSSVLVVGTAQDGDTATVRVVFESAHPVTATDAERGLGGWGAYPAVTPTGTAAAPPLQQVLAIALDGVLSVSAPVDTGTVEVLDAGGAVLASLPLERGGTSSVAPTGAVGVRVLDPDGGPVAEQRLTEVLE